VADQLDAVGGRHGVGAVGIEAVPPSLAVVVEVAATALGDAVGDVGAAPFLPRVHVVDVAAFRSGVAAGTATAAVAGEDRSSLGGGEVPDRASVAEDAAVGGQEQLQGSSGGDHREERIGHR
jgi:hypothetical protein